MPGPVAVFRANSQGGTLSDLKRICQSVATLDAIIMQEWELRYYSYNSRWSLKREMASMRNGSGDHYFILFVPEGCAIKGFYRGAATAKMGYSEEKFYSGLPSVFEESFLHEPAFTASEVSFVLWRLRNDAEWTMKPREVSATETGADLLLHNMTGGPEAYQDWATNYYERDVPLSSVRAIYQHHPVNQNIISELNPKVDQAQLAADLDEIGYPKLF